MSSELLGTIACAWRSRQVNVPKRRVGIRGRSSFCPERMAEVSDWKPERSSIR